MGLRGLREILRYNYCAKGTQQHSTLIRNVSSCNGWEQTQSHSGQCTVRDVRALSSKRDVFIQHLTSESRDLSEQEEGGLQEPEVVDSSKEIVCPRHEKNLYTEAVTACTGPEQVQLR